MIRVSVMYPRREGARFDMDYYCTRHMPLVRDKLGDALTGMSVDKGVGGGAPGSAPTYTAIGHLLFESVSAYEAAFAPNAAAILGDIPNYTDIEPVIQVSEIEL
jgi:uncharacterized protein (TIGR02118 family)